MGGGCTGGAGWERVDAKAGARAGPVGANHGRAGLVGGKGVCCQQPSEVGNAWSRSQITISNSVWHGWPLDPPSRLFICSLSMRVRVGFGATRGEASTPGDAGVRERASTPRECSATKEVARAGTRR
jgi:hypothetical protein